MIGEISSETEMGKKHNLLPPRVLVVEKCDGSERIPFSVHKFLT